MRSKGWARVYDLIMGLLVIVVATWLGTEWHKLEVVTKVMVILALCALVFVAVMRVLERSE